MDLRVRVASSFYFTDEETEDKADELTEDHNVRPERTPQAIQEGRK